MGHVSMWVGFDEGTIFESVRIFANHMREDELLARRQDYVTRWRKDYLHRRRRNGDFVTLIFYISLNSIDDKKLRSALLKLRSLLKEWNLVCLLRYWDKYRQLFVCLSRLSKVGMKWFGRNCVDEQTGTFLSYQQDNTSPSLPGLLPARWKNASIVFIGTHFVCENQVAFCFFVLFLVLKTFRFSPTIVCKSSFSTIVELLN